MEVKAMSKESQVRVPVVCTRGIIIFPNQDVMIEVGRQKSINAVASTLFGVLIKCGHYPYCSMF